MKTIYVEYKCPKCKIKAKTEKKLGTPKCLECDIKMIKTGESDKWEEDF